MAKRLLALIALSLLSACARQHAAWGNAGEVRIAYLGTIYTLNPIIAFGQRLIDLTQIYAQPLVGITPDNKPQAVLCTEVPTVANGGISRDGLTITYHLRNVRFADGVPFTSRDVAFTYRAILDPRNPVTEAAPYRQIAALETPDPHTVVIRLKAPWAGAVNELFGASDYIFGILPAHAFTSTDVAHAAWNDHPFGTGPFRVVQWNRGDSLVLEANPYAWQPPHLKRIVVKMVPDENGAFVALQSHEVDFTDITYDEVARARARPDLSVVPVPRNETDFVEVQTQSPQMRDLDVRRAIAYAIDRATLARTIYHGFSPLATTEIPPLFPEHDASVTALPYDPAKARALLRGKRIAARITFNLAEDVYRQDAIVIQENLRSVGIDAIVKGAPPSLYYAPPAQGGILYNGTFELEVGGWYGGLDPEASEPWICANRAPNGPNTARWCDAAYDAAFADQKRALGSLQRTADFHTMQERVAADIPVIFLVYRTEFEAINPALHGFEPNMLYNFGKTQDWSVTP